MNEKDQSIDEMIHHLDASAETHTVDVEYYHPFEDQPKNVSWVTIFCSVDRIATETSIGITYADSDDFQEAICGVVKNFFNPTTLQYVIDGRITQFGMQIGPELPSGGDLNEGEIPGPHHE